MVIVFVLLALCAIFIASLWMGSKLIEPARANVVKPGSLPVQDMRIDSASGAKLAAWLLTPPDAKGNVILMHGKRSNRLDMLQRARFLFDSGYNVLLFDFQAHGESEGQHITFGHLEGMDAASVAKIMRQRFPNMPLAVIGISLGGASALLGLHDHDIDALVLEAVYTDIISAISNRLRLRFGGIGTWLTPIFTSQLRWRLGITPDQLNPLGHIAAFHVPMLIIGGAEDQRATANDMQRLYTTAGSKNKKLWIIEAAGHEDFYQFNPAVYQQHIGEFLSTLHTLPRSTVKTAGG